MSDEKIYKLLKLLVYLMGRLSIPVATFCSDLLGLIWFKIDKRHRTVTLDNIEKALGDRIKDIENNTQNYTTAIESMVRRFPDQYFWVYNRWKIKNVI